MKKNKNVDEEIIEPFFINRDEEKRQSKYSTGIMNKLNAVCYAWQDVTGKAVENAEEAKAILADPEGYWRSSKVEENVQEQKPHTLMLLDEGFEELAVAKLLKLPANFRLIKEAVGKIKPDEINWRFFDFFENQFQLSAYYQARMDGKIWFHAVTPLQKRRLEFANNLKSLLKEADSLLKAEAEEAGIDPSQIHKVLKKVDHIGPIPSCLKVTSKITGSGWNVEQDIDVNEHWIVGGFAMFADKIGLPALGKNSKAKPVKSNPIVYLKYSKVDFDGVRRKYIVPKHSKDSVQNSFESRVQFEHGEFILDHQSGKLIPKES